VRRGLLLVGAGGVAGLLVWLVARKGNSAMDQQLPIGEDELMSEGNAFLSCFNVTALQEGGGAWDAWNPDDNGAGASFGVLQFNQRAGSLGLVLVRYEQLRPGALAALFGPSQAPATIANLVAGGDRALSVNLAPYRDQLKLAALRQPAMQEAMRLVAFDQYWTPAAAACAAHGWDTLEELGVVFDVSINQGPGAAHGLLDQVAAAGGGVEEYCAAAASRAGKFKKSVQARLDRVRAALQEASA
jgi:hypothetical protein